VQFIASVLSLAVIIFTSVQAYLAYRHTKRSRRRERVKAAFNAVCTTPAPSIAEYEKIYEDLLSSYGKDERAGYLLTDLDYIHSCIEKIRTSHRPHLPYRQTAPAKYCFPVVSKPEFLLSRNEELRIHFRQIASPATRTASLEETRTFLDKFDIGDFATYLRSNDRKLWNARTFELSRIESRKNDVTLSFQLGDYYRYVNNNEPCPKELYFHRYISQLEQFSTTVPSRAFRQLAPQDVGCVKRTVRKMSRCVSRTLQTLRCSVRGEDMSDLVPPPNLIRDAIRLNDLFSAQPRPTCMGISAFVIMNKGNGKYCTFIQKRDSNQVEYPGCFHVAPAGTFQPLCDFDEETIQKQCALAYTVLRELLEEVFGLEEADRYRGVDPFGIFELNVDVPRRNGKGFCPGKLLEIGKALEEENHNYRIVPTSFAVDLMTAKPHVSTVLVIKKSELYRQAKRVFKGNWEGNVKEYDIESDDFKSFLEYNFHVDGFPPVGAVTVSEGMAYYWTHRAELLRTTAPSSTSRARREGRKSRDDDQE